MSDLKLQTWDAENRSASVTQGGATTTFTYNGDGARVKVTVGNVVTAYVGNLYEVNPATGVTTTYYYFGSQRVAMRTSAGVTWLAGDHLGSTSLSMNSGGARVSEERYYPYGATRVLTGTMATDFLFTGQKNDGGTGLYYYGARYYDTVTGRFISADTVVPKAGNPQDLNRYAYTLNNPVRYTDGSGHIVWIPALLAIGTVIGGVGNLANYALNSHGDMTWEGAAQATAVGAGAGLAGTAAGLAAVTLAVGVGAGTAVAAIASGAAAGAASNLTTNVLVGEPDKFANMGSAILVGGALGGLAGSLAPQRGFTVKLPGSFTKGLGSPRGGYAGPNTVAVYEAEAFYDAAGQFYGAMTESYDPPCGGM